MPAPLLAPHFPPPARSLRSLPPARRAHACVVSLRYPRRLLGTSDLPDMNCHHARSSPSRAAHRWPPNSRRPARSRRTQSPRLDEIPVPGSRCVDVRHGVRVRPPNVAAGAPRARDGRVPGPRCVWAREVKSSQGFVGLDRSDAVPQCEYQRARWRSRRRLSASGCK